jgi:peptidoglycan/xylan/chitin deacetylase (PgdA/CDA1 family)
MNFLNVLREDEKRHHLSRKSPALFTTSWDDGHPFDLRIADLLQEHQVQGTFYIPRKSDKSTLPVEMVRRLSEAFEIGAHTLNHVDLLSVSGSRRANEIVGSKKWVEDVTGRECKMFCPPKGRFDQAVADIAHAAGFLGIRTVELMSLNAPLRRSGIFIEPTSLQVYNHSSVDYMRNSVKRHAWKNIPNYWSHRYGKTLVEAAESMFCDVETSGGCFHLWGHSWEIEQHALWKDLNRILAINRSLGCPIRTVTNSEVCIS